VEAAAAVPAAAAAAAAVVSVVTGEAWATRSNQDCRFLTNEEAELCEVMVLTGEDSEPLVSQRSGEE